MNSVRGKLSLMMFLQYFAWGSWGVSAGGYMGGTLKFSAAQIGWVYATTAIAAMVSPLFVGFVADRYFSTEKILATLHAVGAVLLFFAAKQTEFGPLMTIMQVYALLFMPTLALTNSISFQNIGNPEREFPRIRVWGTIGWIAAGWVVGFGIGESKETFFYLAAVASAVLALYCLMLPHTPPKGATSGGDVLGVEAVRLLKEPSFAVFVVVSLLICIPLAFYYTFANGFLVQIKGGFPTFFQYPTALQTIGQISEIFFMAAMPWFIVRLGVKYMLLVGMLAWAVRYVFFSTLNFPLVMVGLILHGVCYDFFFVASQIYVDAKAPRELRSSAQSFIAFVTLGVGMFLGSQINPLIVERYKQAATGPDGAALYDWNRIWLWPAAMAAGTAVMFWIGFHDKMASQKNAGTGEVTA